MRWRALTEGQVFVRQNPEEGQLTVAEIRARMQADHHFADKVVRYGEGLRGSRQFWMQRRSELTDMIKHLGPTGLVFFTFSAADLHWPELHSLMPHDGEFQSDDPAQAAKNRRQDLIENPHIAAWFFHERFQSFFKNVLVPKWKIDDFWYRYEWQHRGSVHVHGIAKVNGAPEMDWAAMKNDPEKMEEFVSYVDSMVTTMNPGIRDIDSPAPLLHPCQKNADMLSDDLTDYIHLLNKLQRHTRCSSGYCLRKSKQSGELSCRFGFPIELQDTTAIREDKYGRPELHTARNDGFLNAHDRIQIQGWRANVDKKPVLTIHAALQYIAKYASKSEPRSAAFSDIFGGILRDAGDDDTGLKSFQRLLLHTVAERDYSAQETCHLLLQLPMYHCSRQFITLNLAKNGSLRRLEGVTGLSPLQNYWNRSEDLENISLFSLNLTHKVLKGIWKERGNSNIIIRVFPRPSPVRNGPDWTDYCRSKVLLHVPHRKDTVWQPAHSEDGPVDWPQVYANYLDVIESAPPDLLGCPVDDPALGEEEEHEDAASEDEDEDDGRLDWMRLAEMGPAHVLDLHSDLGSRDEDRSHDWLTARQRYSYLELQEAPAFIRQQSSVDVEETAISDKTEELASLTLNDTQAVIVDRIRIHYSAILEGQGLDPIHAIVMGTAGTGKSYLINAIKLQLDHITYQQRDRLGGSLKSPVALLAPTGVAAFNIHGRTIHSALLLSSSKNYDLSGEKKKALQQSLEGVIYVVIDEKSMVGRRILGLIDLRLRQAFPGQKDVPFGGRSVILVGDFGQLPPVCDIPMYVQTSRADPVSNNGRVIYAAFREVYKLEVIQRQAGDSEDQQAFRDLLLRLRNGLSTVNDWNLLKARVSSLIPTVERHTFANATRLFPLWAKVKDYNLMMLRRLRVPIAKIKAVHNGQGASKASSDDAKGLEAELLLAVGARVMLTVNVWTSQGLVNGAMGTIRDIVFADGSGPTSLPIAAMVEMDDYSGPAYTDPDGHKVVPITPVRYSWEGKSGSCFRLQLPLCLAWAVTVHKSQGLTLPKAVIDLENSEFAAGLSFVAISRVRALTDLLFDVAPSLERLQKIRQSTRLQERVQEEDRLVGLIS